MRQEANILPQTAARVSPFAQKPMLVFWETTRACLLACRHCRAEAQRDPLPGELATAEARELLRTIRAFGDPPPVVVFTGGDLLMRSDIFDLIAEAHGLGLHVAAAPAATPLLTRAAVRRLKDAGASAMSLSIDAVGEAHDALRGVPGTFASTLEALRFGLEEGLQMQVNSVAMRRTLDHLPGLAALLVREGVRIWEVFFLIVTGRALQAESLAPEEYADVCQFLLDATRYDLLVRSVEGPMVRRVLEERRQGATGGPLRSRMLGQLEEALGEAPGPVRMGRVGTLDGDGIVFVGYDGTISPGGFLPLPLGNVRGGSLIDIYRAHPLLQAIRSRSLHGPCADCAYRDVCGGSRARAYSHSQDPLATDPLCPHAVGIA